jgi:hypothetical protein
MRLSTFCGLHRDAEQKVHTEVHSRTDCPRHSARWWVRVHSGIECQMVNKTAFKDRVPDGR